MMFLFFTRHRAVWRVPAAVLTSLFVVMPLVMFLAGCQQRQPAFEGGNLTGTHLGKDVVLVDQDGQKRQLADYRGKVLVVFFGFTQCPDICPTSLTQLRQVMQALESDAQRVQVVMITVDPEHDTPAVMKQYVTTFDHRFVGLTGSLVQIQQAAASFKAYYVKVPDKAGTRYSVDHSSAFYLLDTQGEARVLVPNDKGSKALLHDIKLLLSQADH